MPHFCLIRQEHCRSPEPWALKRSGAQSKTIRSGECDADITYGSHAEFMEGEALLVLFIIPFKHQNTIMEAKKCLFLLEAKCANIKKSGVLREKPRERVKLIGNMKEQHSNTNKIN